MVACGYISCQLHTKQQHTKQQRAVSYAAGMRYGRTPPLLFRMQRRARAQCCRRAHHARTGPDAHPTRHRCVCACPCAAQDNAISAEIVSDGLMKEDLMEELDLTELESDAVLLGCCACSVFMSPAGHHDTSRRDHACSHVGMELMRIAFAMAYRGICPSACPEGSRGHP